MKEEEELISSMNRLRNESITRKQVEDSGWLDAIDNLGSNVVTEVAKELVKIWRDELF